MRNTLPLLSRPTDPPFHSSDIPSIRLVTATPSASGFSSEASTSLEFSWTSVPSVPSPLAPKVDAEPRKRLVPKKSKLSLLGGGSKDKQKVRGKDLSDVVRRVGGGSTSRRAGGFEIYVDPADPDIGEIVMVKKKKSRAGLDGLRWGSGGGALGEVTNVPSVSQPVTAITKVKAEEKEKWWTLGRGRKDSKEKEKEKVREKSETRLQPPRSKTPEPFKPIPETQSRARFNSLDSGMLLTSAPNSSLNSANYNSRNTSTPLLCDPQEALPREERHVPGTYSRSATPTFGGLLAPPTQFDSLEPSRGIQGNSNQNSIALRAMRSIARIGSWAQLKNGTGPGDEPFPKELEKKEKDKVKTKSKEKDDTKKKSKKDKSEKKEDKNKSQRIRNSTSSFEAGALTTSPDAKASLGKKKRSILGLGLPSTMRLPAVRSGSTTSSIGVNNADNNRLSVDSAVAIAARMRSGSTMSTGSSLRPVSTTSSTSCVSSGSSAASVRWDEAGLETVKELRRKERETKRQSIEDAEADATRKKANRESRRSSEGRRRTPIADVFPDIQEGSPEHAVSVRTISGGAPLLTLEEATSDGHERASEDELSTPLKRARPRPLSEQLLGRKRPQGIHEEDGEGVISILSAATNDLAQLINHLDLEATPGATPGTPSPDASQWRRPAGFQSPEVNQDSPTKKTLRGTMSSISSLRPYAQSRGSLTAKPTNTQDLLDQQIAPWPVLNSYFPQSNVPAKGYSPTVTSKARRMHKRTMSPSGYLPEASPPPPLRPLRPAKSRNVASSNLLPLGPPPSMDLPPVQPFSPADVGRAPSSLTFGSRSSSRGGDTSISSLDDIQTRNSVFKATHGHGRNRSSLLSSQPGSGSQGSIPVEDFTTSRPLSVEARRQLGMKGTMGGSDVSAYAVDELDASDPDSDIPDELQVILANQSPRSSVHSVKGTTSFHAPNSPDAPQDVSSFVPDPESETESTGRDVVDLPVFHLIDVDDNHADLDDMMDVDEDDTKKSFDFTGELQKLNESGGSDRASFVEQLEKAFKTPAKIDLRYDFSGQDGLLQVDIPPLPTLPLMVATDSSSSTELSDSSACSQEVHGGSSQTTLSSVEEFPISRLLDSKEPTLLPGSDSISSSNSYDLPDAFVPKILRSSSSSASHPSDGELNRSFKFGGFFKSPSQEIEPKKLISLSDIIPSPSRVRAMSNASSSVDDSVINSIIAKASEVPAVRPRLNSGSRTKRNAGDDSINAITRNIAYRHSRHESTNSFNGFDSFEEVRRGFEFHDYRPSFYPPPVSNSSRSRQNNHSKQESMMSFASISSYGHVVNPGIPDPFDYGLPSLQERPSSEDMTSTSFSMSIDDTFSFLKHAPPRKRVESDASSFYFNASGPSGRGHRRRESNMSVISQGPPISLYNRSFGHRRNDSSTSVSSMAHSYALHGTSGGRAAWAHHRQDASVDSMDSQFSAMYLGRPGIGDKMFDTAANFGAPLTSISASPPGSMYSQSRSSFDSIMDDHPRTSLEDSLFDKTGQRMSVSSESVFGYDNSSRYSKEHLLPQNAFRPVSYLSINSVHSPTQEDDTMISMIGGGHVRRRSVGSVIETSPCVRAVGHLGKRKHAPLVKEDNDEGHARIVEKASIVSTSSSKFGGERMIRATKGLLERQSLEESCLIAEGEDLSTSYSIPVFTRPNSASRSRSSTCTSSSSGVDTPPLSASDGSSTSGGSQSSIDLAQLNRILANATHPISNIALQRDRARARGEGHRRRISQARMSRSSVYETIEEEMYSPGDTPLSQSTTSRKSSPTAIQPVFIVDPADNASIHSMDSWDDERGIVAMRRYYELRSEAEYTVSESRRLWVDTPFSIYALQNFDPPRHPSGMQALLASSVESYGPLPTDLRPRRRRTSSRPSPYPQGRSVRVSLSPDYPRPTIVKETSPRLYHANQSPPLKEVTAHPNITSNSPAPLSLTNKQVFSRATNSPEKIMQKRENVRPRVPSTTRRTALGWSKRSAKASSELKENQNNNSFGQGVGMTPGNNSLRLSRPRPRGRPTPVRPALRI